MIKIVLLNKHFLLRLNTNSERIATKQKRTTCHKYFSGDKESFGFKRMQDIGTTDARHRLFVGPSFFTVLQRGAFFKALEIPPIFADKGDEAISSTSFSSSFPTLPNALAGCGVGDTIFVRVSAVPSFAVPLPICHL